MSGLTNNQHQSITSRPLSSSAPSGGHDRRQRNPYVNHQGGDHSSSGGGRSRGNSRDRVNNRGGGASQGTNKSGPVVEKREKKERSQVFSK
jgi:hypothetical protein